MTYYSRKPNRIRNYDYSRCNYYFLTVCTHNRRCIFGGPGQLNRLGKIVEKHILQLPNYYESVFLDKYVVMPNHIHLILVLAESDNNPDISLVIGQIKRGITKEIREVQPDLDVWQRSFHDHVIRLQKSYEKIWLYIEENPQNWEKDGFYVDPSIEPGH